MKIYFSFFCNARCFICGLLVVLSTSVSAQENLPIVIPPSPTSVQFQRYGDHPVGHFTGVPDITIPLFTIQEGDITVPITMNYHASGFRRFEPDGHVGLGWTLNTGGMVSRQIRGLPDDLAFMDVPDASNGIMLPNIPYRSDYEYLRDLHSHIQAASNIDYQMDMHNYRFLGHSGRFVEDPNNSNERVFLDVNKVIMPLSGHMKFLDDKGIEYNFGGGSGVETQWFEYMRHNSSLPSYFETISTWHLSSILSARYPGRGVSYQYQNGKTFQNNGSTERNVTAATWDYGIDCSQAPHMEYEVPFHPRSNNNYRNLQESTRYARATYQSKFPSQIAFSVGRISFHLSNDRQRLERIEIRNKQLDLLKRITFEYGTFNISTVSGSQYTPTYIPDNRSKLEAIVFRDETGGEIERYSFGYQGGTGLSGNGTDHWGFANADKWGGLPTYLEYISRYTWNSYGTVIGCDTYQWNVGGQGNKEPHEVYSGLFMLNSITYPTGGSTVFEYEGHRGSGGQLLGGVRVKKIREYNGGVSTVREFTYGGEYQEVLPQLDDYRRGEWVYGNHVYGRLYLNPFLLYNPSPMGAPVVYGLVTEKQADWETRYQYQIEPAYEYKPMTFYAGGTGYDPLLIDNYRPWGHGYLKSKAFLQDGFPTYTELYSYTTFETGATRDLVINKVASSIPTGYFGSEYHLATVYGVEVFNYANRYHPIGGRRRSGTIIYKDGTTLMSGYSYDNPQYPTLATGKYYQTSEGETVRSYMAYSHDKTGSPYEDLAAQNRMDVLEEISYRMPDTVFREARRTGWKDWGDGLFAPATVEVKSGEESAPWETDMHYHAYDANGNIESVSLEYGARESYLWGYDGMYPVIKGVNMTETELLLACDSALAAIGYLGGWKQRGNSFLTGLGRLMFTGPRLHLQNFVRSLREHIPPTAQVSVYTYSPGYGMTSNTDGRGETTYFDYDSFQRLEQVEDTDNNILKRYKYNLK